MSADIDSQRCAVIIVPAEAALDGERVAVSPAVGLSGPALLTVAGRLGQRTVGVRIEARPEVPSDRMVVADSLAERIGLTAAAGWRLTPRHAEPIGVLTLEAMVEEPAQKAWRAVQEDATLAGRCFWTGDDVDSCVVELGSRGFRVRSMDGRREPGGLRVVDGRTMVELFVPGARVGLDVVVLADQSGSMEVPDLPVSTERLDWHRASTRRNQTRMEALQDALRQMLQARLRISGRESRLAMLAFNEQVHQIFPRQGMVPLDGDSSPALVEEFVNAVRHMYPHGGTNIEAALLRAAEVLDAHGVPDNDRLIVLVSDGKTWKQKGAASTGEMVWAGDDPVALMAHLHHQRRIRLHAIGISTAELYAAWARGSGRPEQENLRPDHPLLTKLLEVGGGDPSRIGGIDVLESYFAGLGAGLTRNVGHPANPRPPVEFTAPTRALLSDRQTDSYSDGCQAAVDSITENRRLVNSYARVMVKGELDDVWKPFILTDNNDSALWQGTLLQSVSTEAEFGYFILQLAKLMIDAGPGRKRGDNAVRPASLVPLQEPLERMLRFVRWMRNAYAHDPATGSSQGRNMLDNVEVALMHYVGVPLIEPSDTARWGRLRLAVLEDAADCLRASVTAGRASVGYVSPADEDQPDDGAADGPPTLTFDLRN